MKESVRNEIIRLAGQGLSQRRIAQQLRVSRHTVHHALEQVTTARNEGASATPGRRARSRPSLEGFDPIIQQLLERYPDLTAQRLWEELRNRGCTGSYPTVWRRLAELRPAPSKPPVIRFETSAGAQAQMDYASYTIPFTEEGPRRVQLFS